MNPSAVSAFNYGWDTLDIHVVGRNASTTKPAKFLMLLVKNKDAPVLIPVK